VNLDLKGRRALVTGGSSGIGLASARALAAEGADVALVARRPEPLSRAAEALAAESGRNVFGIAADTGVDESVTAMIAVARERLGGIDILVNAAATASIAGPLPEDELEAEINVKVRGYLRCARAVAPLMAEAGWGRIVNIGGLSARRTGSITGSVRNAAVAALSKNLADELGPQGINVTVVHPGMTRTERTPEALRIQAEAASSSPAEVERAIADGISIGRLPTADEVAAVVAFLASPRSVAINGDAVVASGGARGAVYY
jgi:NAD(P)-dependent dehydrogenase (short-subunit alcohol dehydrogenase family)